MSFYRYAPRSGEGAEEYAARVGALLPNFPADVLIQWFHRHPNAIHRFSRLGLERLEFSEERWFGSEIPKAEAFENPGDYAMLQKGARHGGYKNEWLLEQMRVCGTWPCPPIFLANPKGGEVYSLPYGDHTGRDSVRCRQPWHLLEGHHRLAYLPLVTTGGIHRVWVARRTP